MKLSEFADSKMMGILPERLIFLAFVGLTGFIIYNALYLQDMHVPGAVEPIASQASLTPPPAETIQAPAPPAVTSDLPPDPADEFPEQLVRAVQRELAARGYSPGTPDGTMQDMTRSAIETFEKDNNLPVTGKPSDDLLRHILLGDDVAAATPTTGSIGQPAEARSAVKAVQQILSDLGYSPGTVDGTMSGATKRAISAFQRDRKIPVTGEVSPALIKEIKRVTGRTLAANVTH